MKEFLSLKTAPAELPLSLEEVKEHLRIVPANTADDDYITLAIAAATVEIDGAKGWLGRALITQTWTLHLDRFPCGNKNIIIPLPPLQSIDEIRYVDTAGDDQVLDEDLYRVLLKREPAEVEAAYGTTWPSTRDIGGAVEIDFTAGFGDDPEDLTEQAELVRAWLKIRIGGLYATREPIVIGTITSEIPHIMDMLENMRIRGATNEDR